MVVAVARDDAFTSAAAQDTRNGPCYREDKGKSKPERRQRMWLVGCKACSLPFVVSRLIELTRTECGIRITCPSCGQECVYGPADFRSAEPEVEFAGKKPAVAAQAAPAQTRRLRRHT
jgi:hypothetical protein